MTMRLRTISENVQLVYGDTSAPGAVLACLDKLRQVGELCDCVFKIEKMAEHFAHRAVLAAVSPVLLAMFEQDPRTDAVKSYTMPAGITDQAFQALLDFAYTGRICIRVGEVKDLYRAAVDLKFSKVSAFCADHLITCLTFSTCLEVREFFDLDPPMSSKADAFIQKHLEQVKSTKAFLKLPHISIKMLGQSREEAPSAAALAKLIADWLMAKTNSSDVANTNGEDPEAVQSILFEHDNIIFLSQDNHIIDAEKVDYLCKTDAVLDYLKVCRKYSKLPANAFSANGDNASGSHSSGLAKSNQNLPLVSLIACDKEGQGGSSYCLLYSIHGRIHHVSVRIPIIKSANGSKRSSYVPSSSSSSDDEEKTTTGEDAPLSSVCSFEPLAEMSVPRCGVGLATLDGRLIALGGNDRGECLDTVECYNVHTNTWTQLPHMISPRGRFECAVIGGKLYACGGSDGRRELDTVECFDGELWSQLPRMTVSKSSAGVGVLNQKLYVVGGTNGTCAQKSCEMFDPESEKWSAIADLNIGRSQAAVCHHGDLLYAFGGTDSWNCFSSVEVYNPKDNTWSLLPPMSQARRGAAAATFKGKLYIVGGSNGSCSLTSVEIYDPPTGNWSNGPSLQTPRANAGLAVCAGRLYITGGYGGNGFLSSSELLEAETDSQWCCYVKSHPQSAESSEPDQ